MNKIEKMQNFFSKKEMLDINKIEAQIEPS